MNRLALIITLFLISCSIESDKFSEKKHIQIFLDGFSVETIGNTLYLYEDIYIMSNGEVVGFSSLRDLLLFEYLQEFFWIVNSDTIREYRLAKEVSYGKHFVKLFLTDSWGDTLSYSDSIWVNESFSISLLSPVNNMSNLSAGDIVQFQYKINGVNEEDNLRHRIYICTGESCETSDTNWKILDGNFYRLPNEPVFWCVEASKQQGTTLSEIRSIWPKN